MKIYNTSRSFESLPYNWYLQVVGKTCFSSTHLSSPAGKQISHEQGHGHMNITVLQPLLFLHRNACDSKLGWQCRFLRMWPASRMAQCDMRKSEYKISNFYQTSAKLFSFWVHHMTSTRIRTWNHGIQSCRKHIGPQVPKFHAVKVSCTTATSALYDLHFWYIALPIVSLWSTCVINFEFLASNTHEIPKF